MIRRAVVLGICLIMAFTVVPFTTGSGEAKAASWNSMKIYGIYMHRENGVIAPNDNYGDAVLIESNGNYLLMDCGERLENGNKSNVINKLHMLGVKELDIYISHMHGDHTGGLEYILEDEDIKVNNLYLPDEKLCERYYTPNTKKPISKIYEEKVKMAEDEGVNVIYLAPSFRSTNKNAINHFTVGAASFDVVGPVGENYTVEQFAPQDGKCGTKEGHYLNNCSLTTIVTCGGFRYMTAGDIEKQEEDNLTNKYGYGLKCDVMKGSHHGLSTSNNSYFVSRVAPTWSFEENHGYYSIGSSTSNLKKYGFNYEVATNRATFIVDVDNNNVKIYRDWNGNMRADEAPLTGWVNTGKGYQYYNGSGYILKGWQWISGYAYYLGGTSGYRYTGSHKINGVKVKFSSSGKLTSHKKPAKVTAKSAKAKGKGKIKVSWNKASRASRYQVYRSTYKSGGYQYVATVKKSKRSFTNGGLVKGQKYYYKVRATRNVAGGTMYGSFSKPKKAVAK